MYNGNIYQGNPSYPPKNPQEQTNYGNPISSPTQYIQPQNSNNNSLYESYNRSSPLNTGESPYLYETPPPELPPKPETLKSLTSPQFLHPCSTMAGPRAFPGNRLTPQLDRRMTNESYGVGDLPDRNNPSKTRDFYPPLPPKRSPVHTNFLTPSKAPYPNVDLSELPETPSFTATDTLSSPFTITTPSPQRRPMGPRAMSSFSSFTASPSTSPIKFHNYNDRRQSYISTNSIELNDFVNMDINGVKNSSSPERRSMNRKAPYPTDFQEIVSIPFFNETSENISTINTNSDLFIPDTNETSKFNFDDLNRFADMLLNNKKPPIDKRNSFEKKLPLPPSINDKDKISFNGRIILPFSADSINARHFAQTKNIKYLSSIFEISLKLEQEWTDGTALTAKEYKRFLQKLLKYHLPKLKSFVIDDQVDNIINSFDSQNCIFIDDELDTINFFPNVKPSGVLTLLTGCYTLCHAYVSGSQYQCHSSRCSLYVYKPPIPQTFQLVDSTSTEKLPDWATFWKLTPQDLQEIPDDQLRKQSHIFDLIRQQQNIIRLGKIQVEVYGPSFTKANPKLVKEVESFTLDAFESVKPLIELHQKWLLNPLVNKLNQEGKFISGVGEIFLNWTQLVKSPYLNYTRSQANVREFIKSEKVKNSDFAKWLKNVDQSPQVLEASLDHDRIFSSGFIGHTQQLPLALDAIKKLYRVDDLEYKLLEQSIEFINNLNRRIDSLQERSLHRRNTKLLNKTLRWRTTIPIVDLDLLSENRKLIKKSDVLYKEGWSSYVSRTLILLDNYLLITIHDEGFFKIIEIPIPVSILQVELKVMTNEETLYPFKVKHSGLGISFTFFTDDEHDRTLWFEFFKEAKSTHISKGDIIEPFKLRILSDQFISTINRVPSTSRSLLSPQLEDALKLLNPDLIPSTRPIMESEILCGCSFHFENKTFHLIGLNYGLFLTEAHSIEWRRVLQIPRVTQVEVMNNNLLILISSKGLYYFNLISILLNYYNINHEKKIVGDRLSSKDNVLFFKIAHYKNIKLLFVLKNNLTGSNKFKIFTPIFDVFKEFQYFQLYKRLDIDSTRINSLFTFNEYFVLLTDTEFEFYKYDTNFKIQRFKINLETKDINKISNKEQVENIKRLLKKQMAKPVLIKDSNIQRKHIFLIYDEFVILVNSHGDLISNSHILPFNLKAKNVIIWKKFLLCSNEEVIQVFDLRYDSKGFLKYDCVQIIHGNNIKLVNEQSLIYVMMHPKAIDRQLLISLNYLLDV